MRCHKSWSPLKPLLLLLLCLLIFNACASAPIEDKVPTTEGNAGDSMLERADSAEELRQRPLHLPSLSKDISCPNAPTRQISNDFTSAMGDGPVYVVKSGNPFYYDEPETFGDKVWGGEKTTWVIDPKYEGIVLVRGKQLDGTHEIRFNLQATSELLLRTSDYHQKEQWPHFPGYTRIQTPGCYAYQIDGKGFSYIIVFKAVLTNTA